MEIYTIYMFSIVITLLVYKYECHIFSFHGQDIFYPFSAFDEKYAKEVVSQIILERIGQHAAVNVQDIKF